MENDHRWIGVTIDRRANSLIERFVAILTVMIRVNGWQSLVLPDERWLINNKDKCNGFGHSVPLIG